jgi:hypothetical protein
MYPHPYRTAQGGTGFTTARLEVVSDQISSEIAEHGAPETIVIMAGVIDVSKGATTAAIIAEMASVEADLVSQDINVVWLAEPGWTYAAQLAPIVDWVKTRPNWIDCRASAGASQDGIHPNSYTAMAACVNVELAGLGFGL